MDDLNVDAHQLGFMEEDNINNFTIYTAFYLYSQEPRELKISSVTNGNWHWTNDHKVMKHVRNLFSICLLVSATEVKDILWTVSISHPTNHVISSPV